MDRLVPEPRTFKELVEADLRRAARLVIKVQDEIDPQFRIATPEGDYWIAVTLPQDARTDDDVPACVGVHGMGNKPVRLSWRVNSMSPIACTRSASCAAD
jgi:hypothetical protein